MSPTDLKRASDLLWAPVPRPVRPKPKPQESWRTLKVGQWLELTQPLVSSTSNPTGTKVQVTQVTSEGVTLELPTKRLVWWSNPEWRSYLKRTCRPKTR